MKKRSGLSLIEVILSLAIFMMSLAAIGQLVTMGSDRGLDARFTMRGTRLAESKMAEIEVGAVGLDLRGGSFKATTRFGRGRARFNRPDSRICSRSR